LGFSLGHTMVFVLDELEVTHVRVVYIQAFSFENTRQVKNDPCHIKWVGQNRAMCGNVAAKRGDACLLFGS